MLQTFKNSTQCAIGRHQSEKATASSGYYVYIESYVTLRKLLSIPHSIIRTSSLSPICNRSTLQSSSERHVQFQLEIHCFRSWAMPRGVYSFFFFFGRGFFSIFICASDLCVAGVACAHTWHNVVASWRHISFSVFGIYYTVRPRWFLYNFIAVCVGADSVMVTCCSPPQLPCLFMVMGLRNEKELESAQAVVLAMA